MKERLRDRKLGQGGGQRRGRSTPCPQATSGEAWTHAGPRWRGPGLSTSRTSLLTQREVRGLGGHRVGGDQEGDIRRGCQGSTAGDTEAQGDWEGGPPRSAAPSPKPGLNPRRWAPSPGPLLGEQSPGVGASLLFLRRPPAPQVQWGSQGLCGKPGEERRLVGPIHRAAGSAMPAPRPRLGSPSWGCQPAPTHCHCPPPQLCHFLEPQGFGPGPGRRVAGSTSPFTRWHRSRGNAGRQLGTGAQRGPPPAQPTPPRGAPWAAPRKPPQDGALEILSTNYESGDKQGICKSISDRTFPGKSRIQAQPQTGPHAGSSCPSPCLPSSEPRDRGRARGGRPGADRARGLRAPEGRRVRPCPVKVSWWSGPGCPQRTDRGQSHSLNPTCSRTGQLLAGHSQETAAWPGWPGGWTEKQKSL